MFRKLKLVWCSVILCCCQMLVRANYANSTISAVKMISDDFQIFQQTGQPISRRDGRKLISFNTKNDNIEVDGQYIHVANSYSAEFEVA